jgi:CHAT domain-containing protein
VTASPAPAPTALSDVWLAFMRGEIAFPQALQNAVAPDVLAHLDADEVDVFARTAASYRDDGQSLMAAHLFRLLLVALDALPDSTWRTQTLRAARISAMQAAKTALAELPDGVLFSWALSLGQAGLDAATGDADIGEFSFQCGALYLDPYISGRMLTTRAAYEESIRLWFVRFQQNAGDALAQVAQAAQMPEPADALTAAEGFFRTAAVHQLVADRGLAIKALLQTIEARAQLYAANVDGAEVDRFVADALTLLQPRTQGIAYAAVIAIAQRLGRPVNEAMIEPLLRPSLAAVAQTQKTGDARELVVEIVPTLQRIDPLRALALFVETRSIVTFPVASQRSVFLTLELRSMLPVTPPAVNAHLAAGSDTGADRAWLDAQPATDATPLACAYVSLAFRALNRSQEPAGLTAVARLRERFPAFVDDHRAALDSLEVTLLDGWAVDASDAAAYGDAITRYGAAITRALQAGLIEDAFSELAFLNEVVMSKRTLDVLAAAANVLSTAGLALQAAAGDRALWSVVVLAQKVLFFLLQLDAEASAATVLLLLQTLKGARFASELATGARYDAAADPDAADQLARIVATAQEAGGDLLGNASVDIDEETLLSGYIRRFDSRSGAGANDRLANLQHRFDAYVDDRLLPAAPAQPPALTPSDLQTRIDAETVVLNLYLNADPDSGTAAIALLSTNTETVLIRNPNAPNTPIADGVATLRSNIVRFADGDVVDYDAQQQLITDAETILGTPLLTALTAHYAAGRRHLRIIPHGPLHFYPLHLISPNGKPLADDWTITYTPNLQLLRAIDEKERTSCHPELVEGQPPPPPPATSIGLSFEHDPIVPPLTSSIAEATSVAQVFGTQPILDAAATKPRVTQTFAASNRMHLSTHGKHNVIAPAFQCLYVAGEPEAERIFAYELLALDLHGLNVLTLSACETALGRFDRGDNLRGLPASLLLTGVRAIVATLWPVGSEPAATFFPAFYTALEPGIRVRDAFRTAQLACRAAHPMYADWGAFYLIDRNA